MFKWLKSLLNAGDDSLIEALQQQGAIIDVRSAQEFSAGSVPGAVNIAHTDIQAHRKQVKALAQPIVVCCASGMRAGLAVEQIRALGIDAVVNGKTVGRVNAALSQLGK